jgi:hypothetical protein
MQKEWQETPRFKNDFEFIKVGVKPSYEIYSLFFYFSYISSHGVLLPIRHMSRQLAKRVAHIALCYSLSTTVYHEMLSSIFLY